MAVVKPIKGIRPTRDKAHLVASRAVNVYKQRILNAKLEENPYTFMHIILPEFGKKATTKPNTTERFKLVRKKFESYLKEGILKQDAKPAYYIYQQIKGAHSYTGIIAGTSVDDYNNGVIKIHEQTLTKREEIFTNYLDVCEFNAEPVLLAYDGEKSINAVIKKYTKTRSEYEFTTSDKVTHLLWIVDKPSDIKTIENGFKKTKSIYIADGHHRSSSSALLADLRRKRNKNHTGKEMYNFCLSYLVSSDQLRILEFNRLVNETGKLTEEEILSRIGEKFVVKKISGIKVKPGRLHQFTMYMNNTWYMLTLRKEFYGKKPVDQLDAQILTTYILAPIFGIVDLKNDSRIDFAGGNLGTTHLQKKVDSGDAEIAFCLYPVTYKQLKLIADTHSIMPPKSTYIEPKLRSGLVIQSLK